MSDEGRNDETTVISAGVSVTKRLEPEEFDGPIIAFDIESRRDGAAAVTVVDSIPGRASPRDLRFHPEYGSEHWVIDDGELIFEREFDPGEEYVTIYRLCEAKDDSIDAFGDPAVDVEPDTELTPGASQARGITRSAGSAAGATNDNPASDAGSEGDSEASTLELSEPVTDAAGEVSRGSDTDNPGGTPEHDGPGESSVPTDDRAGTPGGDEDGAPDGEQGSPGTAYGAGVEPAEGSLVAALATELEEGTAPAGDVERLRAALGRQRNESGSVAVRVGNGTGAEAIAEFRTAVDDFREEVERFEADLERVQTAADRAERRVGDVETAVDGGFEDVREELGALRKEVRGVHHKLNNSAIDDRLSELEQAVGDLQE